MVAAGDILSLPPEPPPGAIVEILDGNNRGERYRRDNKGGVAGWLQLYPPYDPPKWSSWSMIWWSVTEDGGGGTRVRVTIPDPDDPHPLPWHADYGHIWDATGDVVPPHQAVARVNELGQR